MAGHLTNRKVYKALLDQQVAHLHRQFFWIWTHLEDLHLWACLWE